MQFQYSYDANEQIYIARGDNELGYISETADSMAELMEKVQTCVEILYEDIAEETNKLNEQDGNFSRFQVPKAEFVKVEINELYQN